MRKKESLIHALPSIRELLDSFPYYVFLVDRDHHILTANSKISEDFNLTPEEVKGKYCPKVIHGFEGPYPGCPLEEAVKSGKVTEKEFFDEASGGWFLMGVYPTAFIDTEGKKFFYIPQ